MEEAAPAQQYTFVLKSSLPPEVLERERERFIKPERNPESARLWNELETNLLLDLVERNYQFLTGAVHPGKNRKMVNDKSEAITNKVNALGLSSRPLKYSQVKKKWHDLKSLSKKELNKLKVREEKKGSPANMDVVLAKLSDKDLRIYNMAFSGNKTNLWEQQHGNDSDLLLSDDDISGSPQPPILVVKQELVDTDLKDHFAATNGDRFMCESSAATTSSLRPILPKPSSEESYSAPSAKKRKIDESSTENGSDGESLLQLKECITGGMEEIRFQLSKTNHVLETMATEMRRSNDLNEKLVAAVCKHLTSLSK